MTNKSINNDRKKIPHRYFIAEILSGEYEGEYVGYEAEKGKKLYASEVKNILEKELSANVRVIPVNRFDLYSSGVDIF